MTVRIGLVVPGLTLGGGVPAVARFVRDTIVRSGEFALEQVSLSTSSNDACNTSLAAPRSWLRGVAVAHDEWESRPYAHVGATAGELEFQRYRPRAALARTLARCDLIQVVCGAPAWANSVLGLGKPVALQVATRARVERRQRNANPRGLAGWWRKGMTEITDRLDDRALRRVDAIQVENPWMLDYARSINAGREVDIRYAPPGIDARHFRPAASIDRLREPCILCVGRLDDPRKNVGMLLDAYAMLPAELRECVGLVLAGSSPPPATFWERAEALGVRERVNYHAKPDADTLVSLYQHASVFALPSDEEGLGVVLVEAMACGVPVIATRCGGPDGIITDGEDGYLVPRDDAAMMSHRLATLLQEPDCNAAMGATARATVERRYDERVAGQAFLEVWDHLLHKRGAARCAV
jgi:glycosyltransferase involved in cell wall biosynthesis